MDKMRWRYGNTNPVVAKVDADTKISIGDLVWHDEDDAKPAKDMDVVAAMASTTDSPRNQFADNFLGVAEQRSREDDSAPIRVATTGTFEFECSAMQFELGDLIGVDFEAKAAGMLDNQQVVRVDCTSDAIGRAARFSHEAVTSVLVSIRSTVMTGGIAGDNPICRQGCGV